MNLLVVSYHYCRVEQKNKGIHAISHDDFIHQVNMLGEYYSFISLSDLKQWIDSHSVPDGNYCLLTFDDGLKEQMECFNILQEMGIPGAFFVVSDTIEFKRICTIHKFHYARSMLDDTEVYQQLNERFNISSFDFGDQLTGRYIYDNEYARKIKYFFSFCMNKQEKELITDMLFDYLNVDNDTFLTQFYMGYDDVVTLANAGALGSHTTQHEPLTTLSEDELGYTLSHSKKYLQSISDHEIFCVTYPSGKGSGMSKDVAQVAKESGFSFGFTVNYGINNTEIILNNPFELLRVSTNDAPGGSRENNKYLPLG